jgi:hypothetical protein
VAVRAAAIGPVRLVHSCPHRSHSHDQPATSETKRVHCDATCPNEPWVRNHVREPDKLRRQRRWGWEHGNPDRGIVHVEWHRVEPRYGATQGNCGWRYDHA